jgi:hypothetical protein
MKRKKETTLEGDDVFFLTPENETDRKLIDQMVKVGRFSFHQAFGDWRKEAKGEEQKDE